MSDHFFFTKMGADALRDEDGLRRFMPGIRGKGPWYGSVEYKDDIQEWFDAGYIEFEKIDTQPAPVKTEYEPTTKFEGKTQYY